MNERCERWLYEMPKYYQDSEIMQDLLCAILEEHDLQDQEEQEIFDQFIIDTATWGLQFWEEEFNVSPMADDTFEIRRARIKAKWLMKPPMTVRKLEMMASSFVNKEVKIIPIPNRYAFYFVFAIPSVEYNQVHEFRVGMTPIKTDDKLVSYKEMVSAIEKSRPAHLRPLAAPTTRECLRICSKVYAKTYEYHQVHEFRVGMTPIKSIKEVAI